MRATLLLAACLGALTSCSRPDGCTPTRATAWPAQEQIDPTLPAFPSRAGFAFSKRFASSFEAIDDFAGFYLTPSPYLHTTWQDLSPAQVHTGANAHHAWVQGINPAVAGANQNHRGYPTIQLAQRDGPYVGRVRVELWVWLDMPLDACADQDWFSFATLSSYADVNWYQVQLVNVDAQGIVHLMHVPTYGQQVHDIFQTSTVHFPQRQWVKLTVLIDYASANPWGSPMIAAWQDEQLVSAARFSPRIVPSQLPKEKWPPCLAGWDGVSVDTAEAACQLDYRAGSLAQAHFGLYSPRLVSAGEVFNDDLEVLEAQP